MHRRDMPVRRDRGVHHLSRRDEQITHLPHPLGSANDAAAVRRAIPGRRPDERLPCCADTSTNPTATRTGDQSVCPWEIASSDGCRFRDGKHASINLMLHRLLLPEQLGLIPAPATTG
jgi:hypothetical protein